MTLKLQDVIDPKARQVPRDVLVEILEYTYSALPPGAKILLLSHCGARAFGWGTRYNDYDIHGIFACKGYFDYVHSGYTHVDLNLHEVYHIIEIILRYHSGEMLINLATPVYINTIDPNTILSLASKEFFPIYSIESELKQGLEATDERRLLHGFRKALVPTHYFETGKWNTYLPDLWQYYGLPEHTLAQLIQLYQSKILRKPATTPSRTELETVVNKVVNMARETLEKKAPTFNWERFFEVREQLYTLQDRIKCYIKIPPNILYKMGDLRKIRIRS